MRGSFLAREVKSQISGCSHDAIDQQRMLPDIKCRQSCENTDTGYRHGQPGHKQESSAESGRGSRLGRQI